MGKEKKLIVISSPTGGGKNTITNLLLRKNKKLKRTVSCTTRPLRENEKNGRDYYFISEKEFKSRIRKKEFVEWAKVHNSLYGTLKGEISKIIAQKKIPVLAIDVQGALNIKKLFPQSILIFIKPNSIKNMVERIKKRAYITEKEIQIRLKTANKELKMMKYYDYIILNPEGEPEKAVEKIREILKSYL